MIYNLLNEYGYTVKQFSKDFNIPYNTVRQWYNGERQAPEYVRKLIEENLKLKTKGEQLDIEEYIEVKKDKKIFPRVNYLVQWKVTGERRILTYGYTTIEEVKAVVKTFIHQEYRILMVDHEQEIDIITQ